MRRLFPLVLAVACSCSSPRAAPPVAAAGPAAATSGPVIARFVMRRQTIVARAGADGPTYALESRDGRVLWPAMTVGQLAVRNPNLHRTIQTMETAVSWAGLDND